MLARRLTKSEVIKELTIVLFEVRIFRLHLTLIVVSVLCSFNYEFSSLYFIQIN